MPPMPMLPTPSMLPTCSIIVAQPNESMDLTGLVTLALATRAADVAEILLVGDGVGLAPVPEQLPRVRRLSVSASAGFATAANAAADAASGRYLLFVDPAMRPRSDALEALLRQALRSSRAGASGAFGAKVVACGDTIQQAGAVFDQEGWPRRLYAGFPADHPAANRTRRLQILSAACLLVSREALRDAGGFDPTFAADDAAYDLCLRLRLAARDGGGDVYYVHDGVCDAATLARATDPESSRSRRMFRARWRDKIHADDVACYHEDGLLRLHYDDGDGNDNFAPARASIAAPLEIARPDPARVDSPCERLLASRARQVRMLLQDNARLSQQAVVTATATATASAMEAADPLLPPPDLALSVGGEFREVGEEFLRRFIDLGGLQPTDRVLDVGCGVGRMAVPLTRYLARSASYDGFDITPHAIAWCQTHITPRFPHFRFHYVPLRNDAYNAQASQRAATFQFPFPAASFDFILLTSVFTHLLPDAAQHYVAQIAAALKPGGRCFATFFLLNPESNDLMGAGLARNFSFSHSVCGGICRVLDHESPEAAVAYDEAQIRAWFDAAGLAIADPIHYGRWCGRTNAVSLQDILIATKSD
jgi:GT2 family glycosyltransferase/SAM-dependent methyltransferase